MASHADFLLTTLLFFLYGLQMSWCQCHNSTALSIQLDALLAEYDREMPPPNGAGLIVHVKLDARHATINQHDSTMRLLADLKMTWEDQRVKWNTTDWGCDYAIVSAERLWLPDIVLLNAAATGVSTSPNDVGLKARLDYVGAVTWVMRLDLTAPITLDLYNWPKDTQTGVFKFGSRAYGFDEIEMQISDFHENAVLFESGAWKIESIVGHTSVWSRGGEHQSVAMWFVTLTRRAPAHALAATTVLVAIALLLTAAVALPPEQRPALAACTSFIAALWLTTALVRLPGGGGAWCPRALALQCAACACGAACAASAALARAVSRCAAPPPRLLRSLLSSLSTVCRLTPSPDACATSESGAWAAASVLLDRAACAALLLTLLVLLALQLF